MKKQFAIIIRGVAGSGKTTLAQKIVRYYKKFNKTLIHCETDFFRLNEKGEYHFDPLTDFECHKNCFKKFKNAINNGFSVVVSNCFVKKEDMLIYTNYLQNLNVNYIIIKSENIFNNIHNVPNEVIYNMKKNFEPIEEEIVLSEESKTLSETEIGNFICNILLDKYENII